MQIKPIPDTTYLSGTGLRINSTQSISQFHKEQALLGVLICLAAIIKYQRLGTLNNRNILLIYGRLEVQDRGISRFGFF